MYVTEAFGVSFHQIADINGIALLYLMDDARFGKVIFEAVSITVEDIPDEVFDTSNFGSLKENSVSKHYLIGRPIKPVKLRTLENQDEVVDFESGKIYVLNFWFKACMPCIKEIPLLNQMVDSLASENIRFLAIFLDEPDDAKEFLKTTEFKYDQYAKGGAVANKFGIESFQLI